MGKFDSVGGLEYLAELPEKVPTTANVDKYIKIVEEKAILRNLIKTANEIIEEYFNSTNENYISAKITPKGLINKKMRYAKQIASFLLLKLCLRNGIISE